MVEQTLLGACKAALPTLNWFFSTPYGRSTASGGASLEDGRRLSVEERAESPRYQVDIRRTLRETPCEEGESGVGDVKQFGAERRRSGDDLNQLLAEAYADDLPALDVLGLRLYPDIPVYGEGEQWIDETCRFEFSGTIDGSWRWRWTSRAAKALSSFFRFGEAAGDAPTLAEAVAEASAAPQRIGALLMVLADEYSRPPAPEIWAFAGQVVDHAGERVTVGPTADLLALKALLAEAERPFLGRMNTDESFIAAIRDVAAADTTADEILQHREARRLRRY